MKVFISWSGDLSKNIAEILRQWFPGVIQAVRPYYSPDDITKGTRWNNEISKELDESKIGIICLTRDNLEQPWIMFEAGALSKNIDKSKVCPLLFGIEPTDIQGPLVQFQSAKFSKKEMKKVVKMMNAELGDNGLVNDVLDSVFEMWWPKLDEKIQAELINASQKNKVDIRSERDMLEEILKLSRDISVTKAKSKIIDFSISPRLVENICHTIFNLVEDISHYEEIDPELLEDIDKLYMLLEDLLESLEIPRSFKLEMRERTRHMREEFGFIRHRQIHRVREMPIKKINLK